MTAIAAGGRVPRREASSAGLLGSVQHGNDRGVILFRLRAGGRVAVGGFLVALALAGCSPTTGPIAVSSSRVPASTAATDTRARAPRAVGPQQFAEAIAAPDRVTINVHVPYEGDIAGTDLTIPFDQIAARVNQLPPMRSTPLAVYCRSGRMSRIAAATLSDLGYQDVVELEGGMQSWQQSGRPLVRR